MLLIARDSASSGASARPTTTMVIRNSATATAEPTASCVTMPSQISAISSSGIEVMTSAVVLPGSEIGTLTEVLSGCTSATNQAGTGCVSSLPSAACCGVVPTSRKVM